MVFFHYQEMVAKSIYRGKIWVGHIYFCMRFVMSDVGQLAQSTTKPETGMRCRQNECTLMNLLDGS